MNHSKTYTLINTNTSEEETKAPSSLSIGGNLVDPAVTRGALVLVRKVKCVSMLSPQDVDAFAQACALIDGDKENTLIALLHVAISEK